MEHATPIRRRGRLATVLAAVVGLAVLLPPESAFAQQGPVEILPLETGNTWTYDGTVWWVPRNSLRVLEERVRVDMRVVDVVGRPGARAALLEGYPPDLLTSTADRFDGEFVLLEIGSTVYLLRGARGREALRRVADPSDSLADLLPGSEVVLDLPLDEGKSFCSPRDEKRRGPGTCWLVREEGPVQRIPVAGLEKALKGRRYVLTLESRTENEVRGFVPGVGFTSFAIGYYGDPSALEMELVDARLAIPPPAPGVFLKTLDLSDGPAMEVATASDEPEERPAYGGRAAPARGSPVASPAPGPPATSPVASDPTPAVEPASEPMPSPAPLLPDRRIVQTRLAASPIEIEVSREALPVPVWEETRPACADAREWYAAGAAIRIDGREFEPLGSAEPIDPDNLVPVGEFDGVPTFAGRRSGTPHTDLWLPLCEVPGGYRLYADLTGR